MKVLYFDRRHYNQNRTIFLIRGDDWVLDCQIGEAAPGVRFVPTNLEEPSKSASAFFQAADGSEIVVPCPITNSQAGQLQIQVPRAQTLLAQTSEEGIGAYVVVDYGPDSRETYVTTDNPLEIRDRSFFNETM